MTITRLLPPLLLALTVQPAFAQEGLIEIYERAMENDPVIRQAEANYLVTTETKRQVRSALLPSVSLSGSTSDTSSTSDRPQDPVTGQPSLVVIGTETDADSTNLSLSVTQTLFDWGQLLSLKQADKTILRAETDFAAIQQELMVRVATAYFNVLGAEDLLAADLAARDALSQQFEQTERQFQVGLIAITEVQEARAGYDQSVASVIASERTLATAQESLREIINAYVTDLRSPIEELPLLAPDPEDVDAWVEVAQQQNLALIASRIAAEIAEDDISIARSSRFPTLRLSASESDRSSTATSTTTLAPGLPPNPRDGIPFSSGGDSTSLSLSLSVPIYSGGANRSRIQQSVYRRRAAIEDVERFTRQTERMTRDAYLGVVSEISRVQALRQALESSRTALLATQAAEQVGQRTRVDVVNAVNNVRRAETTYAGSRYEYLLNILRLKQAAGSLSLEDLLEVDDWLE
jgi:outer membrane protein